MSAATGSLFEVHQLLSWSFTSDLGADEMSPAPAIASPAHDGAKKATASAILALVIVSGVGFYALCFYF
jgi:hypothetical protein